ncbi:hypothetical protein [Piscinibacter gummiphilus]|uniref:Uncharacterized protein n=1 Tax=Piscinibacter gummiphilus TaxID=946333 RepID=A0A1W6LC40_9BURK|nr:hypothetical protein [Piscinibacter gummiphilus]ARN21851.1 hypothetical protein A4W93_19190 [Piscinibacter gummiphilus]ATU66539.1 hypothetical protein CPZ87_19285 [Piscinibacter gummiphilus]GLS93906.1 hypothetical protein GCM10007918_11980 [Piscinibacter gummiphilus]
MPFVYIKVPAARHAEVRDRTLEDGVAQALADLRLGEVISSGESLGDSGPDGARRVAFHRIDVDVNDLASARALFRQVLPTLGAPVLTEVHYTENRLPMVDVYEPAGWTSGATRRQ